MSSNRISVGTRDNTSLSNTDRLALSRAQHLQLRDTRPKSVSDDETDAVLDWSDSDRECCPLSDFETTSNNDETECNEAVYDKQFHENNNRNELSQDTCPSTIPSFTKNQINVTETPYSMIDDSTTSTRISFSSEIEKPRTQFIKNTPVNAAQLRRQLQPPLLPARRIQKEQVSPCCLSTTSVINSQLSYTYRNRKTVSRNSTRLYLHRENTSITASLNNPLAKDSTVSSTYSFQSHDDTHNQRHMLSPNFSQTSVPRVYEIKKVFVDDYDYGRLTDISSIRPSRPLSRQKWGTIVHPPFPLGYQHVPPEKITRTVERLASSARCRDRHTGIEAPSKRYLSTEQTEALISRLNKVKTIRSSDHCWPVQRQSRTVKTLNNNWKGFGISA
ncbi:unnamed protein product [Rotaria socialis]|uniref:Uncharacterized protein n=1 Tax=Rotaria socialis TaxID=392032 RepID=A0A817TQH3_9BILA|nr:unnamed protein product [Rotaria socialis]CAF3392470.1 unnamed protein product [Rotaria socialis]CAF3408829.1 unnamed protein product [Rotaria socialis]CAF4206061.1 unnamed protein product [Rotaria socialis]CAF4422280.1 unnamed protein product [Rotaria socialis]